MQSWTVDLRWLRNSLLCCSLVLLAACDSGSGTGISEPQASQAPEEPVLVPCWYWSQLDESEAETDSSGPFENCASVTEAGLSVEAEHLHAITGGEELGSVLVEGSWYYVLPSGESLEVPTYDNGPDSFAGGLVRSKSGGKIGYYDENFELIVPARYDWGWPFENGLALVCVGCVEEKHDDEEHTSIVGGEWGVIDMKGREIVSFREDRDEVYDRLRSLVSSQDP